jgi:hypothetical protein
MVSGKQIPGASLKNSKKTNFRRIYYPLIGLAMVLFLFVSLLLYEPVVFNPPKIIDSNQVSVYLTHVLSPQLYNGVQRQEPFDLIVTEEGINDIISRSGWPMQAGGIKFSAPTVFFVPDTIVLMGQVSAAGVEFVLTVVGKPRLDEAGLLNLRVAKVKMGAVGIRPLAVMIARKMYLQQTGDSGFDAEHIITKIAASLLDGELFEPVFEIDNEKVRISKIAIVRKRLTVHLVPVLDQRGTALITN